MPKRLTKGVSVASAALIFADRQNRATDTPPLQIVGQGLLEYQLRLAAMAGVATILVHVEAVDAAILDDIDRAAADGIAAHLVRTGADVLGLLHPEEPVLVLDGGCVPSLDTVQRLLNRDTAVIVAGPAHGSPTPTNIDERIDAQRVWLGLAVLPGQIVRETGAALGDWALAPTLLRHALQAHVAVEMVDDAAAGLTLARVATAEDSRQFNRQAMAQTPLRAAHLIELLIWSPILSLITPLMLARRITPRWFSAAMALLAVIAASVAALGNSGWALGLFIASGAAGAIARRLHALMHHDLGRWDWLSGGRISLGGLALVIIVKRAVDYGFSWSLYVLVIWLLIELMRIGQYDPWFERDGDVPVWRASPDVVAAVLLGALVLQEQTLGLELATAYAVISSAYVTRRRG